MTRLVARLRYIDTNTTVSLAGMALVAFVLVLMGVWK